MRRRTVQLMLAAGASLAGLGLLELGLRAFGSPPVYIGLLPFDAELGFAAPASIELHNYDEHGRFPFRLNARGSRGRDLPPPDAPRPAGTQRVLFLGDSFLQAWAVREEELMSTVCERLLEEAGQPTETFVLSCDDYGTAQELLMLERHGARIRPDIVVLAVYPPNDLPNNALELAGRCENSAGDYLRPYFVRVADGRIERTFAQPARAWLRRLSVFAWLDHTLMTSGLASAYAPWPLQKPGLVERLKAGQTPAEWHEVFRPHAPGTPWDLAWETTGRLLRAVAERTRALGARLLVLGIPACAQAEFDGVMFAEWEKIAFLGGSEVLKTLDLNLPERTLAGLCQAAGIELRLLLEPLREAAARTRRMHFVRDGHLNGSAHELAGAIVADWMLGGSEFPLARPDARLSAPADILPECAQAPRWLDVRDGAEQTMLAHGWARRPDPDTGQHSWSFVDWAWMVLPVRAGTRVVLVGKLLPDPVYPATLTLGTWGSAKAQLVLDGAGPFEFEFPFPGSQSEERLRSIEITLRGADGKPPPGVIISGMGVR